MRKAIRLGGVALGLWFAVLIFWASFEMGDGGVSVPTTTPGRLLWATFWTVFVSGMTIWGAFLFTQDMEDSGGSA